VRLQALHKRILVFSLLSIPAYLQAPAALYSRGLPIYWKIPFPPLEGKNSPCHFGEKDEKAKRKRGKM
jgi:hypothetical protein